MSSRTDWHSLDSSNLSEVKYEESLGLLFVRFKGRAITYIYTAVPKFRFRNLLRAKSHGRYFNKYIRDAYVAFKEIT